MLQGSEVLAIHWAATSSLKLGSVFGLAERKRDRDSHEDIVDRIK